LSLSFWFSHQNPICILLLPHAWYMPCPSHPSWLDHSNYIWQRVQVMKLFPNIWTLPHFQGSISYLYVMMLPSILVMRHQYIRVLGILCVYFQTSLLTSVN
jgi:hypothetical protein